MTALTIMACLGALTLALIGVVKRGYADRFIEKLRCKRSGRLWTCRPGACEACDDDLKEGQTL